MPDRTPKSTESADTRPTAPLAEAPPRADVGAPRERRGFRARLEPLVQRVGAYAALALGSGAVLWTALLWPFDFPAPGYWLLAVLILLILLAPGALVWLTYGGLRAALALPERLGDAARDAVEHSAAVAGAARGGSAGDRAWKLSRTLFGLRSFVLERRAELVGVAALGRFANPLALAVLLGSFVVSGFVVAGAALALVVRLLLG